MVRPVKPFGPILTGELRWDLECVNLGTDHSNLTLTVEVITGEREKRERLLALCRKAAGPRLVYVGTRKRVETLTACLRESGVTAGFYPAGMAPAERAAA